MHVNFSPIVLCYEERDNDELVAERSSCPKDYTVRKRWIDSISYITIINGETRETKREHSVLDYKREFLQLRFLKTNSLIAF